jgi:hypothetical protein
LRQRLALERQQLRILDDGDEDCLGARHSQPFVVPVRIVEHVVADASPHRGILETFDHFLVAAVVRPRRDEG